MRIIACLCWFDEDPDMLMSSVASWSRICEGVVAVDGAFTEYPGDAVLSHPSQAQAIRSAARLNGMTATVHEPDLRMTQVEKRSLAFAIGDAVASEGDWLLVVDADEHVEQSAFSDYTRFSLDAANRPSTARYDVAAITAQIDAGAPATQRRLVRAGLGVRCEGLHYRYVTREGRVLWGEPYEPQEEALATDLRLTHRRDLRSPERQAASEAYYAQRVERVNPNEGASRC